MTQEEYQQHLDAIPAFTAKQFKILQQYNLKAREVENNSIKLLTDDLIEPNKLCAYVIQDLIVSSAKKEGNIADRHYYQMKLVTVYLQGVFVARDLVLEGNYNKASAVLKQDVEIVARLHEIIKKDGKNLYNKPNPKYAPELFGKLYGELNDIAHITKEDILEKLVLFTDKTNDSGYSPVKKIDDSYLIKLFLADSNVKLEILRLTLILHQELFGEDEVHQRASAYFNLSMQLVKRVLIVT